AETVADVLGADRDQLTDAVAVHPAHEGDLRGGVEPTAEKGRAGVDGGGGGRFRDDKRPDPVNIDTVELLEPRGPTGAHVDHELVPASAIPVPPFEYVRTQPALAVGERFP